MQGFVHIRIDDRLIHGQVATRWSTGLGINRIMVIDNDVATNEMEKSILRMAAPSGVNTSILPFGTAVNNIKNGNYAGQRVLLVVKSPITLVEMLKEDVDLISVNVGNMSAREGTKQYKKSVNMTQEEYDAIYDLIDAGVKVTAQMVPDDPATDIQKFLD